MQKGEITIQMLGAAGIALVVLVFIIAIGSQIIGEMQEANIKEQAPSYIANESLAVTSNNTYFGLAHNYVSTVYIVENATTGNDVPAGNMTIDYDRGAIMVNDNLFVHTLNVTYDYYPTTISSNVSGQGLSGMLQFSNWFTIIILVLVAVVIISLLIRGLGGQAVGS